MKRPVPVESASALIDERIKELGDWRGKTLAVANMAMLPYPAWFWIANLIVFPASFCLGPRLARERR